MYIATGIQLYGKVNCTICCFLSEQKYSQYSHWELLSTDLIVYVIYPLKPRILHRAVIHKAIILWPFKKLRYPSKFRILIRNVMKMKNFSFISLHHQVFFFWNVITRPHLNHFQIIITINFVNEAQRQIENVKSNNGNSKKVLKSGWNNTTDCISLKYAQAGSSNRRGL